MDRLYWVDAQSNVFELSEEAGIYVLGRTGFGMADANVYTEQVPGVDGVYYLGHVVEPRKLRLALALTADDETGINALRRQFVETFRRNKGVGTLRVVKPSGTTYEIRAILQDGLSFDTPSGLGPWGLKDTLTLLCPFPFWRNANAEETVTNLGTGAVFVFPATLPTSFGAGESVSNIAMVNPGDRAAPLHVELANACQNPKISNLTTGKFVQVSLTLAAGERLRVKTGTWECEVVKVAAGGAETNVLGYLTDASDLVGLMAEPGNNTFKVEATAVEGLVATIRFLPLYCGI